MFAHVFSLRADIQIPGSRSALKIRGFDINASESKGKTKAQTWQEPNCSKLDIRTVTPNVSFFNISITVRNQTSFQSCFIFFLCILSYTPCESWWFWIQIGFFSLPLRKMHLSRPRKFQISLLCLISRLEPILAVIYNPPLIPFHFIKTPIQFSQYWPSRIHQAQLDAHLSVQCPFRVLTWDIAAEWLKLVYTSIDQIIPYSSWFVQVFFIGKTVLGLV